MGTYVRHLDFVALLQMLSEYFDEFLGRDVSHSVTVGVNQRQMLLKEQVNSHRHAQVLLTSILAAL